jgi:hypothetical protein
VSPARLLGCALAAAMLIPAATTAAAAGPPAARTASSPISWLSTGDSFSSGEGITGSGRVGDGCAQSQLAYGPRALRLLQTQRSYTVGLSAFSACTGHLTGDFYNEHLLKPGTPSGKGSLWAWTQRQAGVNAHFDVISFSFGGNDVGFPDLISDCTDTQFLSWRQVKNGPDGCHTPIADLKTRLDRLVQGTPSVPTGLPFGPHKTHLTMAQFYAHVANTRLNADGVLIVVGYPRLLAPSTGWARWRGGMCQRVSAADADELGQATEYFDQQLRTSVATAQAALTGGRTIKYVSRLDLFDADGGHSLCSPTGSEWINGLTTSLSEGQWRIQHSFHPNERGHQRTAEVVAELADQALQANTTQPAAAPVRTPPPPPIIDPAPRYEVGSSFDTDCVNAWPTAPTYTTTSIELTMSCPAVPGQFLFVQVSYPDPNFPITPSTGRISVHGRIVDIAHSAYGYTELVVSADRMTIR